MILDDLRQLAFKRDRALGDPGHVDALARGRRQPGDIEFTDVVGDMRRGGVHLLRQIHDREIPDEFSGLLDIGDAVLPGGGGKADDRRMVAEAVEEAVRRKVDVALRVSRRNPADRARGDDGIEGIVLEAVAVRRLVVMQVFLSHAGIFLIFCSPDEAKRNPGLSRKRIEVSRISLRSIRAT